MCVCVLCEREEEKGQGVKPSEEVRRHQTCSADKKKNDQEDEEKKKVRAAES